MFSERINRLSGSLIREILAAAQRPEVISFAGGLPAAEKLPDFDWSAMPKSLAQYGMSEGEPALRAKLAEHVSALGLPCSADQVLVVSGSQQTLDLAAKLFVDPGTPVLVEGPTFLAALQVFRLFGADCLGVPLTSTGIDVAALEAQLKARKPAFAYLIPTFQNPSGARYDDATRDAVAALLDAYDVPLLEDDPYRDLSFDGVAATPICSRLKKAPWIYTGTLSKTLAPGLRDAFLVASPELFPYFVKLKQAADLHSCRYAQWQAEQWLGTSKLAEHVAGLIGFYRERRDAMQCSLERHFADLADWQTPEGGLFFWLRLKRDVDTRKLLPLALAEDVAFMPGEPFFPDPDDGIGHLRLNFSHAPAGRIEEGIKRLAAILRAAGA
ncbi:PLP-dependent aminotransferase family protein [Crenobacter cavernae]|uniref:Putative 8-amino-7-oxononanoate synthase n=1 Tax=Crenobacter cavernae TaxID=2290923 RepID=A0A345Y2P0_9NEIS|nr:PLP-dependent aminotransferase family protein [Crenobacter cavernae]AXK38192.1 PLP-dependent aminotransferase family protein [Crenobacter cavernae]